MKKQTSAIILRIASKFVRGTSASALQKEHGASFPLVPVEIFGLLYDRATASLEAVEDSAKRAQRAEKFARTFFNAIEAHQNAMADSLACGYTSVKVKVAKVDATETKVAV